MPEYVMPAGEGITEVGESAFKDFGSLRSLVVSEGVSVIGDYAFSEMYNLQYLELPTTVTDLGTRLTSSCRQERPRRTLREKELWEEDRQDPN